MNLLQSSKFQTMRMMITDKQSFIWRAGRQLSDACLTLRLAILEDWRHGYQAQTCAWQQWISSLSANPRCFFSWRTCSPKQSIHPRPDDRAVRDCPRLRLNLISANACHLTENVALSSSLNYVVSVLNKRKWLAFLLCCAKNHQFLSLLHYQYTEFIYDFL